MPRMLDNFGAVARTWLRFLGPSWPLVAAVTVAWGARALMLLARHASLTGVSAHKDLVYGFGQDLLAIYGLFLLVRGGQRLADWSVVIATAIVAPAWLLLVLSPLARAADLAHNYLGGSHISAEAFLYIGGGFEDVLASPRVAGLALAALLAVLATMAWLRRESASALDLELAGFAAPTAVVLGAAAVTLALWRPVTAPPHEFALDLLPEANLTRQTALYLQDRQGPQPVAPVSAEQWQRWQKFGWVPTRAQADATYPLVRGKNGEPEVPYALEPNAVDRPDIVILLVESTSSLFIHELSGHYKGLMPNLGDLTHQMTVVDGYRNVASPTIAGTIGTLCSAFAPLHPADVREPGQANAGPSLSCLPETLLRRGYKTVFIGGHDMRQAGTVTFLQGHGFTELHSDAELLKRFPGAGRSVMGVYDHYVFDYAREQIARLEKPSPLSPEHAHQPYLLVVSTLDTHEPGLAPPECSLPTEATQLAEMSDIPEDAGARRQLAAYHCTDRLIGDLARHLLGPERRDHTMLVITGDHAPFHTPSNAAVYEGKPAGWSFDRLPLLIHDPRHDLPAKVQVLSGTLDVAPTLGHLLGLSDERSTYLGYSIFGKRRDLPLLIGRVGTRMAYVRDHESERELPFKQLPDLCKAGGPLLADRPDAPGACDLAAYFEWLDGLWANHRLRPARALAGGPE